MEEIQARRRIWGWLLYDWANSAYATTVAVAVLPVYFAGVVTPPGGWIAGGTAYSATTLWGGAVALAGLLVFLAAPACGAVADHWAMKKRFLMGLCLMGSLSTVLLAFCGPGMVLTTLGLFLAAQIGFVGGNVFYDAFLPHVAGPGQQDRISGQGYALGYVGGGLQFALSLGLIAGHDALGLSEPMAARLALASAGLWWGGFALFTFAWVDERPDETAGRPGGLGACVALGVRQVLATTRSVCADRPLLLFLLAFFFYNDGIQTVIMMATIYGKEELGFSSTVLMLTLLMIQGVGVFGSLLFGWLGERITARRALLVALALWAGVTLYAYFLTEPWEYFVLGAAVGLVLGGSQSLSRSLYSAMIPARASAEYFGYFSVLNKASSMLGPLVFAVARQATGSSRSAVLFLLAFFVVGMTLLAGVRVRSGRPAGQ